MTARQQPRAPKHMTPNYKLVGHVKRIINWAGVAVNKTFWQWEAQPLRQSRKDLRSVT